jgi:hypothetical protein
MNRREALTVLGGALFTSAAVLSACAREPRRVATGVLGLDDQDLVEEIADTLLPTTAASPGAKAAGAGAVINLALTDCYTLEAQQRVLRGLTEFRGTRFASLPRREREQLLRDLDAESKKAADTHWYPLVRELALGAYFSTEVGMTQALRYVRVPGRWIGCMPLQPGQPAWG